MTMLPHNVPDVLLAPVVLRLDSRLNDYGSMSGGELRIEIGLASDKPDRTRAQRETALVVALGHNQELHGWALSLDDRGLRMSHRVHSLVLGLPPVVRAYLDGIDA